MEIFWVNFHFHQDYSVCPWFCKLIFWLSLKGLSFLSLPFSLPSFLSCPFLPSLALLERKRPRWNRKLSPSMWCLVQLHKVILLAAWTSGEVFWALTLLRYCANWFLGIWVSLKSSSNLKVTDYHHSWKCHICCCCCSKIHVT